MDVSNSKPIDDSPRGPRDLQSQNSTNRSSAAASTPATEAPGELPEAGGPLAASANQNAETQDPGLQKQFKDRLADLVDSLDDVLADADLPANRSVAIEVDEQSNETRFLVVDRDSGEVVRRIPDEELLGLLKEAARRGLSGVIDRQV